MNVETPESFVVYRDTRHNKLEVKKTHLAPGYTRAHKATRDEAIQYRYDKTEKEIADLEKMQSELRELAETHG